jgi:hypothetical protein
METAIEIFLLWLLISVIVGLLAGKFIKFGQQDKQDDETGPCHYWDGRKQKRKWW